MRSIQYVWLVLVGAACGSSPADEVDGGGGSDGASDLDGGGRGDAGPTGSSGGSGDGLDVLTGCAGVFNPDQVLDFELSMSAGDWSALQADSTNSIYFPAEITCNGTTPASVAVRRKRSGGAPKVGLKIDINRLVPGQSWLDLKKLSLENGISEGSDTGSAGDLVAEYLSWRLMARSGAITGRAAFVRVTVNGEQLGVYVNVEEVDKRFLRDRLDDDAGWLYKKSGSANDGYHTNELEPDPYAAYFCFWESNGCDPPSAAELASTLPAHLAIEQMLRVGAMNALLANTDSPLLKNNNFLFYDTAGLPRLYFPWDLDTTMRSDHDVFTGTVSGGTEMYVDVLFSNWEASYDDILTELLDGSLALSAIHDELDRVDEVAAAFLDGDPDFGGSVTSLKEWWTARHAAVRAQVAAH
jgi:spore coat protein H